MTFKPVNITMGGTIICKFFPWYYIINQKSNSKLEKSRESFWFITQAQKFFQTGCFYKMTVQNIFLKKAFSDKSNDKTFKEIKNVYWATAPVVQVNQDLLYGKLSKKLNRQS